MNALLDTSSPADADIPGAQEFLTKEIAPLSVDILIEGETGVGKDVLAREIHRLSRRPGKFIAINCAAVPEHIAESELFGYEAGAFTGAARPKEGKLEAADRGTLYLDEIDSMPLNIQSKLLRALQERGTERLGGSRFYRSDFRVVASTKIPLPTLVEQGSFRKDLYYRLNVVKVRLPPLRDAREKILPLFAEFLADACKRHERAPPGTTGGIQKLLMEYPWPGNIRELKNAAERYALGLPPVEEERGANVVAPIYQASSEPTVHDTRLSLRERVRAFERELIVSSLRRHGNAVAKASLELHISVNTLYYRIKALGIRVDEAAPDLPEPPVQSSPAIGPPQQPADDDRATPDAKDRPQETPSDRATEKLPDHIEGAVKQRFVNTFRRLVNTRVPRAERLVFPEHEFVGAMLDALAEVPGTAFTNGSSSADLPDAWVRGAVHTVREATQEFCADLRRASGNFLEDMVNSQAADRYAKTAKRALENFVPRIGDTQRMFDELARTPALMHIDRHHLWRLCIDPLKVDLMHAKGLDIDANPYIGHLFDSESSYLYKMSRAWLCAMHDMERRLDLALIIRLQELCLSDSAALEPQSTLPARLPEACRAWAQFGMLPGETITVDGENELAQFVDAHSGLGSPEGNAVRFSFYTKRGSGGAEYKIFKRDEAPTRDLSTLIEYWIDDYHSALSIANDADNDDGSDAKICAAIELCQKLQRLRPFPDGNCRTFSVLLLNRLLVQLGEPLAMIDNPNKMDGFSRAELVDLVRQGQRRVLGWTKS
jgi:hypothetical protein